MFLLLVRLLLIGLIADSLGLSIAPDDKGFGCSMIILGGEVVLVRYILLVSD